MRVVSSSQPAFLVVLMMAACSGAPSAPADASKGATACPDAVKQSIAKEFPDASIAGCKAERAEGRDQFEVKLTRGADKLEVDVAPDGMVLQTEVVIALDKVPAAVMAAFTAKYPSAKPTRAEKQTRPGKAASYELAFTADTKTKEATFAEDGRFVGEE